MNFLARERAEAAGAVLWVIRKQNNFIFSGNFFHSRPPRPHHRHHMQQPTEKRKLLSTSRAKVCFASFCVCVCVSVCRSLIHLRKQKFALLRFLLWIDDCFVFVFLPRNRIGFVIEEARSFALHLGFEQRWLRSFALEGRKGGRRCGRPQQNKTIWRSSFEEERSDRSIVACSLFVASPSLLVATLLVYK